MRILALFFLVLLASAAAPGSAHAAIACFDYSWFPHWLGFGRTEIQAVDVIVEADRAFLATMSGGIVIFDVSDPQSPVLLGNLGGPTDLEWPGTASAIALGGNHLYVIDGPGRLLNTVDVSDPTDPIPTASIPTGVVPRDLQVSGDSLYVAVQEVGVVVYDLAVPAVPAAVDTIPVPGPLQHLTLAEGLIYAATISAVEIFDARDPEALSIVYSLPGETWQVTTQGDRAYVAGLGRVDILDVSDPGAISVLGSLPQGAISVDVDGRWAYLAAYDLQIWDLEDPAPTAPVASLPQLVTGGVNFLEHAVVENGVAYVAAGQAGLAVSVVDPPVPVFLPYTRDIGSLAQAAHDMRLDGYHLTVAAGSAGLLVYDVSHPGPGAPIGHLPTDDARAMARDDGMLFLADGPGGLRIVDPGTNGEIGRYDPYRDVVAVDVTDGIAYLANDLAGLVIVDVTDPAAPAPLGDLVTPGRAIDVVVSGQYAFVAADLDDVHVVDVADPQHPVLLTTVQLWWGAETLALNGTILYAGGFGDELVALDVSDPASPAVLGRLPVDARHMQTVGATRLLVSARNGVHFIDVTDPSAMEIIGFLPSPEADPVVAYGGSGLFVAGLEIVGSELPCSLAVSDVPVASGPDLRVTGWPNPFNPRLTVAYELDRAQDVILEVVDLAGRRVAILASGNHGTGSHTTYWDGRDRGGRAVASGTYFVLLRGESEASSRKVSLVR